MLRKKALCNIQTNVNTACAFESYKLCMIIISLINTMYAAKTKMRHYVCIQKQTTYSCICTRISRFKTYRKYKQL